MFGESIECDRTIPPTELELKAIRRAVRVWATVCEHENSPQARATLTNGEYNWSHPNMVKSRLLGRMIHEGLPPTKTQPPREMAGPAWWLLPGGDPFGGGVGPKSGPWMVTIKHEEK